MTRISYKGLVETMYTDFKDSERYKGYQYMAVDSYGKDLGVEDSKNARMGFIVYIESRTSRYIVQMGKFGRGLNDYKVYTGKGYKELYERLERIRELNLKIKPEKG